MVKKEARGKARKNLACHRPAYKSYSQRQRSSKPNTYVSKDHCHLFRHGPLLSRQISIEDKVLYRGTERTESFITLYRVFCTRYSLETVIDSSESGKPKYLAIVVKRKIVRTLKTSLPRYRPYLRQDYSRAPKV